MKKGSSGATAVKKQGNGSTPKSANRITGKRARLTEAVNVENRPEEAITESTSQESSTDLIQESSTKRLKTNDLKAVAAPIIATKGNSKQLEHTSTTH